MYKPIATLVARSLLLKSIPTVNINNQINIAVRRQQIYTSPKRHVIPPIAWLIFKPITKLAAMLTGRGFRKWWAALPPSKRDLFINHLKRNRLSYMTGIGGSVTASVIFYQAHIQYTPITNRPRFILFSTEHLLEIEKFEKEQIFGTYENKILDMYSPYTNRALKVANRIFEANKGLAEVSAVKWKLTVIDADVINAVAFPVN